MYPIECQQPKNGANLTLDGLAELARGVKRLAAGSLALSPLPDGSTAPAPAPVSENRKTRRSINVAAAGDNTIISGSPGTIIEIYELMLWNVTSQTLILKDSGDTDPLQGPLTSFPAITGYYLPDQGEPHFELKDGGSFLLNLGAATQVTGYVRYRLRSA